MNLPGRLQQTTLGDLLGTLYRAGASGVLELIEAKGSGAGQVHRVYFTDGLVDRVESPLRAPKLGEVLRDQGVLARESLLELARRLTSTPSARAGEVLIDSGLASRESVLVALRRQLRLRLDALFALSDAEIRFHVRRPAAWDGARPRPLYPTEFLHGRARKRSRRAGPEPQRSSLDAYRVLGLRPLAPSTEVRRAFRRLAAEAHPDRHPDASPEQKTQLLRRFAELSAAYHALVS